MRTEAQCPAHRKCRINDPHHDHHHHALLPTLPRPRSHLPSPPLTKGSFQAACHASESRCSPQGSLQSSCKRAWPACPTRHAQACLPHPQPQAGLLPHTFRGPGTCGQKHVTSNPATPCPRLPPPARRATPRLPGQVTQTLKKRAPVRNDK